MGRISALKLPLISLGRVAEQPCETAGAPSAPSGRLRVALGPREQEMRRTGAGPAAICDPPVVVGWRGWHELVAAAARRHQTFFAAGSPEQADAPGPPT